jgi:catechol 2,3-dioxygenase-like lactoylglutathione lyase family enzyme
VTGRARTARSATGVGVRHRACAALAASTTLLAAFVSPLAAQAEEADTAAPALTGPAFFALQVRDVDTMAVWYREVFGLREANRLEAEDGRYSIRILTGGVMTVELVHERRSVPAPGRHFGLFKAGIHVSDIARFHSRLARLGVDVDADIIVDAALEVRTFVFRDPEGNRLQAFEACGGAC